LNQQPILFNPKTIEKGNRLRADEYNNAFREIHIDLQSMYNRLRLVESTANNLISVTLFLRDNILQNIERQQVNIQVLKQLVDQNIIFDDIHVIENVVNEYPDKETAADVSNNTITLGRINQDRLGLDTLHNDISIISFNPNINIDTKIHKMDDVILMNTFGKSTSNVNSQDAKLVTKFGLTDDQVSSGMTIGIMIDLSKPTLLNRVSLNSISPFRFNILKVYYSAERIPNVYDSNPSEIDFKYNSFNIDDQDLILDSTISARTLILVVQQPAGELTPEPDYTIDFTEYIDKIKDISRNYSAVRVKVNNDYIHRRLSRKLASVLEYISHILGKGGNKTDINLYQVSLNNISIEYIDYNDGSVFLSPQYTNKEKIHSVSIYDTTLDAYSEDDDVVVQHFITVGEDDEYPIMPFNADTYKHVLIINDGTIDSYNVPFNIDTDETVVVTRNSQTYLTYTPNNVSDNVATGLTLTGLFNVNDVFMIEYTPSLASINGVVVDPKNINIDELFKPNLRNKTAIHNRYINRLILKHTDGARVSYEIGSNCYPMKIPFDDANYDGFVINSPKKSDDLPDYVQLESGVIGVKDADVIGPGRTVYFGAFDELHASGTYTSDSVLTTIQPYVPSSLFVYKKDDMSVLNYDEYDLDTALVTYEKNKINLKASAEYPVDGDILVHYTPLGFISGQTNIASYNILEEFQSTDQDDQIELTTLPHLDNNILLSLAESPPAWSEGEGIWIYKYNNNVVYKPIEITIDGATALDKTQYTTTTKPEMNAFDINIGNYEYVVTGTKIKFNTPVAEQDVAVSYYSNNDKLRLKTRLYRLNRNVTDRTPFIQYVALLVNISGKGR